MAKGEQPHYHLHAMNKATDEKSRIGAAWNQPDGSISISLNPFVALRSHKDLVLRLFPNREAGTSFPPPEAPPAFSASEITKAAERFKRGKSGENPLDAEGDDIPF